MISEKMKIGQSGFLCLFLSHDQLQTILHLFRCLLPFSALPSFLFFDPNAVNRRRDLADIRLSLCCFSLVLLCAFFSSPHLLSFDVISSSPILVFVCFQIYLAGSVRALILFLNLAELCLKPKFFVSILFWKLKNFIFSLYHNKSMQFKSELMKSKLV